MQTHKSSGYTIVELSIAVTLLAVILGAALTVMKQGEQNFKQTMSTTVANTKGNRAINTIARELSGAGQTTLVPVVVSPFSSGTISFQSVSGWDGAPTWSTESELRFQPDPRDPNNGLDDDNDGFVDEGEVLLITDKGGVDERQTVLIRRVQALLEGELPNGLDDNGNGLIDETGFCIEHLVGGNGLTIRLSVLRKQPGNDVDVHTVETTVWLRN